MRDAPYGLIVVGRRAVDSCAQRFDGRAATWTDIFVQIDNTTRAKEARAPGNGAAVIARTGAGNRDLRRDISVCTAEQRLRGYVSNGPKGENSFGQETVHCVRAAYGLEGTQSEAMTLVLQPEAVDTQLLCRLGQRMQRRRLVAGPTRDDVTGNAVSFPA